MNASQRQSILDAILEFDKVNYEIPFKKKYKDTATFDNIIIADFSIAELISIAKKAVSQLKEFLEKGNWKIIPSDNIPLALYGSISLWNTIVNITNSFNSASYEQSVSSIKSLVYFEMQCGFWELPKNQKYKIRESELQELEQRTTLVMSHIDARANKVNLLIKELEDKKTEIEDLIKIKKQELETLKSNQVESNSILKEIRGINQNAEKEFSSIEAHNNKAKGIISGLELEQNKVEEQIKTSNNNIAESKNALEKFNTDAEAKISKIASDYNDVSNNANEVRKMMGYIADGTLSHSFNKRKADLEKSVYEWSNVCLWVAVAAVIWVIVIFLGLSANTGNVWADILINGIKSSPLFFLLGFAISQYQKERNLLEEYAFRESVAVTLTAYLEQVPNSNGEAEKRKLLISTVEQLYTKPIIANKEYGLLKFDSKDLSETSKTLKELIEALLNKK